MFGEDLAESLAVNLSGYTLYYYIYKQINNM